MVGDLEEIHAGQATRDQERVDLLLDVAHQEHSPPLEPAEQHDRDVVDALPRVRRFTRHRTRIRPEDLERDIVEAEPVARLEAAGPHAMGGQSRFPRPVARTGPLHARLDHPADPVPAQQQRESAHVVLVRMGQHDQVDPSIPGCEVVVEEADQPIGVRAPVDEHP